MLIVNTKIAIPDDEFIISYARSSGPGGQNVNKTNSKAILHWDVYHSTSLPIDVRSRFLRAFASKLTGEGVIVIASDEHRQQEANLRNCFEKLKTMLLEVAVPPKIRRPTKHSK
ncbi:MAG: alternative ribosome rescue aminoacyl-tRNA hydrolase ArfB, partial [Proteobacteria bacterium]|nr:alternative ribosome rescue aminoacyl-tRNA hydrolase ArfB [Pseudomonadota bacterium]